MRSTRWILLMFAVAAGGCGKSPSDGQVDESAAVTLARQTAAGKYKLIDTKELADLVTSRSDMVLLDVRPSLDFRAAHILGSTNIPFPLGPMDEEWDPKKMDGLSADQFAGKLSKDPNIAVVIYSASLTCPRSHTAALWAKKLGFTDVHRYAGGMEAWKAAGNETRQLKD